MTTARQPEIRVYDEVFADLFAGGGGTSTGIEAALGRSPDIAINHDPEALAMHRVNHPSTTHYCENVFDVPPLRATRGRRVGGAWFSPDCTYHSKARGGKPFRDRNRARRIRGLAGVVVRWAAEVKPRVLFVENVEEFQDWCPLIWTREGWIPDPSRPGASFKRWVARLRNLGYVVEWRQLRACDFGAPTTRKRLFVIARCDGKPIVWPGATHGPKAEQPYRTAAECIDWSLPVPSIFLTPREARAWGQFYGVPAPRRPLATPTLRRVARGVFRYVIETKDPYIVDPERELSFLAGVGGRKGQSCETTINRPYHTITAKADTAIIVPSLINTRNGERHGRHGEQAPRVLDIQAPYNTITAQGSQGALVAAFLAKHNAGHEATGQRLVSPVDAITCKDSKALVTSHLLKLYGTSQVGVPVTEPMPTITSSGGHGGGHIAEVRAFLVKYFGTGVARTVAKPFDTLTTKDRVGLVTVTIAGEEYVIADIGMRMLTPRELFMAQGFPADYTIHEGEFDTELGLTIRRPLTKGTQTRLVGNSVPPHVAAAIIRANMTGDSHAALVA